MNQQFHPWIFTHVKQKPIFTQNMYEKVRSCFIHNHPKQETTRISFNWEWINRLMVRSHKGILFSNLKGSDIDTWNNLSVSKMHSAKWLHTEWFHLHGKRQNYRTKNKSVAAWAGSGRRAWLPCGRSYKTRHRICQNSQTID